MFSDHLCDAYHPFNDGPSHARLQGAAQRRRGNAAPIPRYRKTRAADLVDEFAGDRESGVNDRRRVVRALEARSLELRVTVMPRRAMAWRVG